jgi:hypothetical protein
MPVFGSAKSSTSCRRAAFTTRSSSHGCRRSATSRSRSRPGAGSRRSCCRGSPVDSLIGIYARVLRSALVEAQEEDYVRTARGKGITERRVMLRHALRTSLIAFVSLFGLDFGALVGGGALLTEVVFGPTGCTRSRPRRSSSRAATTRRPRASSADPHAHPGRAVGDLRAVEPHAARRTAGGISRARRSVPRDCGLNREEPGRRITWLAPRRLQGASC